MIAGDNEPQSIPVTEGALRALAKTRSWIHFLGVLGVIGACLFGLMFLIGIVMMATRGLAGLPLVIEGVILFAIAIFYALYWLRYSRALKRLSAAAGGLDAALEAAFVHQRRLWMFQGVLFIIVIVLAILAALVLPLAVDPRVFTAM